MIAVVGFFADLLRIVEHLFVITLLLFLSALLVGRVASRLVNWLNSRRLRADMGPHPSRGWQ